MTGLHVVAGGVGGALAVATVRTVLRQIGLESATGMTALGALVVAVALAIDLGPSGTRVPSTGVQVPPEWRDAMPVAIWVGAFGALLGFTMLTRVSSALVWAGLIVGALLPGVLWLSLAYGVTFGVARTAVVMTRRTDTIDIVGRTAWKVNAILGLALIFLGTLLGG